MSIKLYNMNIYKYHIRYVALKLYLIDVPVQCFCIQIELFW